MGMSSHQVKSALGPPDFTYVSKFGRESQGGEWVGMVWVYFGEEDPRYKHVERRMKDLYVFYPPEGGMRLNHWKIEILPGLPTVSDKD